MQPIEIQQIAHLPSQVLALEEEAVAEGFRFLTRLISEWHSGANRFDAPGECLMAAYSQQQLIGIGGLSVDPYIKTDTARLRRVYVTPTVRRQHVGQALVKALIAQAALRFQCVRLSTDTSEGDAFYLRCGFMQTEDIHATHIMLLTKA
ncbi:GNAT family N-acetyltransferase [Pseudomonas savastanoi pv. phaseolicola]|uniref:Prophage PSPPH06, acetyltransferase, GNAT family n=4 Tax=Pseudomonas syringae group TaxID=136849 RepID=A0A3M5TDK2_9PSED|nr:MULTISPECIES: GNAT family N-acetyltransferase [Pseudomonas]AAZ35981.1 prophage PSPPH06, acetyltransferase, GNAT family [Pseudomonas savastanoi pv. phaseolicola 1448A]EKG29922.1 prophage PSPPH06, GNAT family acetyltransferase [Pseudomonas avellanae BPIC 631]KPB36736.1 Prophage PSPPH06 [Pseudomonas savastanoi pv. phaseolicola]KPB50627.1 Prophage PSPPH06 [Pseudomonas savastanoi pv. phaseolicola]KPB60854.1 Prophage PSPPH06 [Pseudomonas savastanoi pv. phaseolicola]